MLTPTTFADGGPGSGSLRDAVLQFNADAGTDEDIIQLGAGTYALTIQNVGGRHETAGLTGDLNLTRTSHRWIIQGAGSSGDNATMIDASQLQDRVFQIVNPGTQVVFQDLVIQGGLSQEDGSDGALPGTTDALGGGILNNGGNITLDNVVLQNNLARGGDAAALPTDGHSAFGGGIFSGGSLTIAGATVANNQVSGGRGSYLHNGGSADGGGLYVSGGSLSITASSIASNQGTGGPGGDASVGSPFETHGGDALGGGLYVSGGSLSITASGIASNHATGGAPGLFKGLPGEGRGGGLSCDKGALTVSDSTLSGNYASLNGGGIDNDFGTLTVSNCTLSGNTSPLGGGIGNFGYATVNHSTLSGNSATGPGNGGGIYNSALLTVNDSTLSDNTAGNYGGGIYNQGIYSPATVTVNDSTLSGNTGSLGGGGIYSRGSSLTVTGSTLSGNSAFTGGGIDNIPGLVTTLNNSLVVNSPRGGDITGGFTGSHNLTGTLALGPLQFNGGPTPTLALPAGSPALNAGDPNQLGVPDQRGLVRTGGVNIGAYQASATAFLVSAPDMVQSGVPFDVTMTAVDPFGQIAVGYAGTVNFATTDADPGVVLPADYAFTLDDGGLHTFTDTGLGETTLRTPGDQLLIVTDTADGTITGSATVTVDPGGAAPDASPRLYDPAKTRATTLAQDVESNSANVAVERFFAALAEVESRLPWRRWEPREPGESAGWVLDLCRHEERLYL
jgi:hypothetical protein